jgi:hypothetical protein
VIEEAAIEVVGLDFELSAIDGDVAEVVAAFDGALESGRKGPWRSSGPPEPPVIMYRVPFFSTVCPLRICQVRS